MKKVWKFKLGADFSVDLYKYHHKFEDVVFTDIINNQLEIVGYLSKGKLIILKGYEWDGCTPKFNIFGKVMGVPDFQETYEPSLVHDFLIEYCNQHLISREVIDIIWTKMLKEKSFKMRWLYSGAVHAFRPIALLTGPCKR
jgi:hypothetical protein